MTLDGITKTFVASDGKVASIALDKATIPYATETEVKLVSKDANGVVVKSLSMAKLMLAMILQSIQTETVIQTVLSYT